MRAATALSAIYLASASVFGVAIALQRNPDWAATATRTGQVVWPQVQQGADVANRSMVQPAVARFVAWDKAFFDAIDPPRPVAVASGSVPRKIAGAAPAHTRSPQVALLPAKTQVVPPVLRPQIADAERIAKVVVTPPKAIAPQRSAMTLAPPVPEAPAANAPRPGLSAPSPAELARVMGRLKDSLTTEMVDNFSLFLYVSKADSGPLAQRMYVLRKRPSGDLDLLYNWPVSTGRELVEFAPNGARAPSFTPQGYYELDPDRMYRHHVSGQWKTPMPYAMFFSWENHGRTTGLAIHSATSDDVALLGQRASAGCVRLAPEHAAMLFNLIRTQYKGLAPRFAYDRRTATMSNEGLLMHDAAGRLQMTKGYKVLVFIENFGGDNVVAALF
jgi:lipoprotein-anchoring transpeptidase ErfK/SrfK